MIALRRSSKWTMGRVLRDCGDLRNRLNVFQPGDKLSLPGDREYDYVGLRPKASHRVELGGGGYSVVFTARRDSVVVVESGDSYVFYACGELFDSTLPWQRYVERELGYLRRVCNRYVAGKIFDVSGGLFARAAFSIAETVKKIDADHPIFTMLGKDYRRLDHRGDLRWLNECGLKRYTAEVRGNNDFNKLLKGVSIALTLS